MDGMSITIQGGIMKYISLQDLIDHGKELRFQSAEQMAKVYEEISGIEIIHCKDCVKQNKERGYYPNGEVIHKDEADRRAHV